MSNKIDGRFAKSVGNFKNKIINGGFDVWQRSESYAYSAGVKGYYAADRVLSDNTTDGQFTVSKSEMDGNNSIKFLTDTPPTDLTLDNSWHGLDCRFEGQDLYSLAKQGRNVTISFLFKSNVTGEYPICFRNFTDTSISIDSFVTTFNYTTVGIAQKVEVTVPLDYAFNPALQNDTSTGFSLCIGFLNQGDYAMSTTDTWQAEHYLTTPTCVNWGATAGNYIEIAQLQLEEGSIATEFEQRPLSIEQMLCYRYYEKFITAVLKAVGSDDTFSVISYAEKRDIPTIIFSSPATGGSRYDAILFMHSSG